MSGILYLVPNALGPAPLVEVVPHATAVVAAKLAYFVGENAKSTRAFLKRVDAIVPLARPIQEVRIEILDTSTPASALAALLAPVLDGEDAGIVSEAGCPGIADPGALLVRLAHERGVEVRPLVGPSSLLLALMASGLDGQRFAFGGYLPTDAAARARAIRDAEERSKRERQTQVFIETPYRNRVLLAALLEHCRPDTWIGVACDLTQPSQWIATKTARQWKGVDADIDKRPTVFMLLARRTG